MGIIDQGGGAGAWTLTRIAGYGFAVIGFVLPILPASWGGPGVAAIAMIAPAIVFALLLISPESFGATFRRWGGRPGQRTISPALILPVVGLLVAATNASVIDTTLAFLPAGVCALIAVLLGFGAASRPMPGGVLAAVLFFVLFGGLYGYGGLIFADVRFDGAQAQSFDAAVQNRYENTGKSTAGLFLVLAPFGPVTRNLTVRVDRAAYTALNIGDEACVAYHPGALKMPWITAAACPAG